MAVRNLKASNKKAHHLDKRAAKAVSAKAASNKAHHLDKRAARILTIGEGDDDDLLSTVATAEWLGVSEQWLELGRSKNYGPRFTRLSPRVIRYRRGAVRAWLKSRTHKSTTEYA